MDNSERDLMTDLMDAVDAEKRLATELKDYDGRWVAVKNHEVVAEATTLEQLLALVDSDEVDAVFPVSERATASFF